MRALNPFGVNKTTKDISIVQGRRGTDKRRTLTFKEMVTDIAPEAYLEGIVMPYYRKTDDGALFIKTEREVRTVISAYHYQWLLFDEAFNLIEESRYEYMKYPEYKAYIACIGIDLRNFHDSDRILYVINPKEVVLCSDLMQDKQGNVGAAFYPESIGLEDDQIFKIQEAVKTIAYQGDPITVL